MAADLNIRQSADGSFFVRPYLGENPITGKKIRPYRRLHAQTLEDAELEAREWIETITGNPYLVPMLDAYVDELEAEGRPANTVRTYRTYVKSYVAQVLPSVKLKDLTPRMLGDAYRHLLTNGGVGGKGVSRNTAVNVHWFLRGAYKRFVADGVCDMNPTIDAAKPLREEVEAPALDDMALADLTRVLESTLTSDEVCPLERNVAFAAWLALHTGMRCGEVCGLVRSDVRFSTNTLHIGATAVESKGRVERQLRTKGGKSRNISFTDDDSVMIKRHLLWCNSLLDKFDRDTPVVTVDGNVLRPSVVSRTFTQMCRDNNLPPGTHFHTLRHTHATWLLSSGVDIKTVSERLGHSKPTTTLGIYAHALPGRDLAAAEVFGNVAKAAAI